MARTEAQLGNEVKPKKEKLNAIERNKTIRKLIADLLAGMNQAGAPVNVRYSTSRNGVGGKTFSSYSRGKACIDVGRKHFEIDYKSKTPNEDEGVDSIEVRAMSAPIVPSATWNSYLGCTEHKLRINLTTGQNKRPRFHNGRAVSEFANGRKRELETAQDFIRLRKQFAAILPKTPPR